MNFLQWQNSKHRSYVTGEFNDVSVSKQNLCFSHVFVSLFVIENCVQRDIDDKEARVHTSIYITICRYYIYTISLILYRKKTNYIEKEISFLHFFSFFLSISLYLSSLLSNHFLCKKKLPFVYFYHFLPFWVHHVNKRIFTKKLVSSIP